MIDHARRLPSGGNVHAENCVSHLTPEEGRMIAEAARAEEREARELVTRQRQAEATLMAQRRKAQRPEERK